MSKIYCTIKTEIQTKREKDIEGDANKMIVISLYIFTSMEFSICPDLPTAGLALQNSTSSKFQSIV